jgi:hypothetical protein
MVERGERRGGDEAAGIVRRCGPPKIRVRRKGLKSASVGPRPDPAAPHPRRRGESTAPLVQPGTTEADVVWLMIVSHWDPRAREGAVGASDGTEYKLAVVGLARSGLTTLVIGQKCEFRAVGSEADWVRPLALEERQS